MISVSTAYNNLISNGGHYEWQIINGANTFTSENLVDGSVDSTLLDGVSIGNTISAQLNLSMRNVTVDTSSPLVVQFRATDGSSNSSWYTKGTYYIDTLETSPYSEITKITAFDSMLMTEYVYQLSGEWTAVTDLVVLNKITGFIGIALESATQTLFTNSPKTLSNAPNIGEDGTTAREMLSYIGALRGGNWRITPDNKLQLIVLSTAPANTAAIGDAVTDIEAAPTETVKKVRVWINDTEFYAFPELPLTDHNLDPILTHTQEEITIRASQWAVEWEQITGRMIDVQIPFFCTYALAKAIWTQFKDMAFYPYSASKAYVDPKYEVGDGITIKNTTSIIASQTIDVSPLAPSSVELKRDEMINSLYPYKAPFRRKTNYQMSKNTAQIAENTAQIAENTSAVAQVPTLIEQQTELITGGYGGYIKFNKLADGTPSEMLIMDTPSEDTATDIIRLNRNGIGFSTDGGATYGTAWTIDGKFNAVYIQTGTLSADCIAANSIAVEKLTGSISDSGNTWNINLTNGTMTIGSLAVGSITGSISSVSTSGNSWGINFTNGTMNIGTLAVGKITGSISNTSTSSSAWGLDFTNGTLNIGSIAVSKITGSKSLGNNWSINFDTGVMNIGSISANSITSGTLNVGNLTVTGTIQDNLSTPKNYWNLTTGEFVTTQGTLAGFTVDATGISAATQGAGGGSTVYTPQHIWFQGSTVLAPLIPFTEINTQGLWTGILDSSGTSMLTDSVIALASSAYQDPSTGDPMIAITTLGNTSQTWGIFLSNGIGYNYTAINLVAQNVTVNNHGILEIH